MEFWIRTATLQIGTKKYSLDDLTFDFEVPFEDSEELVTATINAYNLSAATRNGIRKGDPVIINAGYEGDMGVIFVGQVSGLSHKRSTTDWCTKITATEALDEWLTAQINKTYQKGIKAKAMLQDLLNIFGIEIGTFDLALDKEYPRGKVCKGKLKDVVVGFDSPAGWAASSSAAGKSSLTTPQTASTRATCCPRAPASSAATRRRKKYT